MKMLSEKASGRLRGALCLPQRRDRVHIYTDGSANQTRGGWAFLVARKGRRAVNFYARSGRGEANSARMELRAVVEALERFKSKWPRCRAQLTVFTDAKFVADIVNGDARPKTHLDLVERLVRARRKIASVSAYWVPAHTGIRMNEFVDREAKRARGVT